MREDTLLNLLAYCFCKNKIELKDSFLYKYRIIDTSMSHKFDEKLLFQQQLFFAQAQNIAKMFNLETQGLKIREDYAYCGLIQMLISADVKVFKKSKLLKEYYNYLNNKNILLKFSEIIDFPLSLLFKLVKLKIFLIVSAGTQIIIKMRNKGC